MKADIYVQTEFIKECLRKGEKRIDILAKFNKKYQNKNTRVFDARLKIAGEAIQAEFDYIASKVNEGIEKAIKERTGKIMSVIERQEILTAIGRGELEREEVFIDKGQPKKIKVKPDFNDMKGGIAELNKMGGDYAAQKTDITSGGKRITGFNYIVPDGADNKSDT